MLTGDDQTSIFLFDPYYRKKPYGIEGNELITDDPFHMNRCVSYDILNQKGLSLYNLGPIETREAIILFNMETQKTPAITIEYFI